MQGYALIGGSYPSECYERLHQATLLARRTRRVGAWDAEVRPRPVWRGSGEAVLVPPRKR